MGKRGSTLTTVGAGEALAGEYPLGSPFPTPATPHQSAVIRQRLREGLINRVHGLTWFFMGLGYYGLDDISYAEHAFLRSGRAGGWTEADAEHLLYLSSATPPGGSALWERHFQPATTPRTNRAVGAASRRPAIPTPRRAAWVPTSRWTGRGGSVGYMVRHRPRRLT